MTTNTTPSLFLFEETAEDAGVTTELTIDLAKVALMAKRASGKYWVRMTGGDSLEVPAAAGVAIRSAWIAYQGKFNPATDR